MHSSLPTALTGILFCRAHKPRRPKRYIRKRWKEFKHNLPMPKMEFSSLLPEFQKFPTFWKKKNETTPLKSTINLNSFTLGSMVSTSSTFASVLKRIGSLSNPSPPPSPPPLHRPLGPDVISSARRFPPPLPSTTFTNNTSTLTSLTLLCQSALSTFPHPFTVRVPFSLPTSILTLPLPFRFLSSPKPPPLATSVNASTLNLTSKKKINTNAKRVSPKPLLKTSLLNNPPPVVKSFPLHKSRSESSIPKKIQGNPEMQIIEYDSMESLIRFEGIEAINTTTTTTTTTPIPMTNISGPEPSNPPLIEKKRVEVKRNKRDPKKQKRSQLKPPLKFRRTVLSMIEEEELEEKIPGAWIWGFY